MEVQGIIRPSKSSWNSPLLLVPRKSGKLRPVIDYRRLNKVAVSDHFPIPVITDLLRDIGVGNHYFSAIDLTSGFWQMGLTERSKQYTAFSTPNGHWEFERMPYGLKTSPISFARLMNTVFHNMIGDVLLVYMDDLLIVSKTQEEHFQKLELVFGRLREANLLINIEKSKFFRSHLEFLGHEVCHEGLVTTDGKIKSVTNYPTPASVTDIKSFLGLVGFCRPFIPGFANILSFKF